MEFITSGNFKKRNVKLWIAGQDKVEPYQARLQEFGLQESFTFAPSICSSEDYSPQAKLRKPNSKTVEKHSDKARSKTSH